MKIERYAKSYLTGLLALYQHLNQDDVTISDLEALEETNNSYLNNPVMNCFLGVEDSRVICSCTLAIIPNFTRSCKPYGLIENVVTHPEHQRCGHGKTIIQYSVDYAWNENCYKVMLMSQFNAIAAHSFYEVCGFSSNQKQAFIARSDA